MSQPDPVIKYWFSDLTRLDDIIDERMDFWFRRGEHVDEEVRGKFADDVRMAAAGHLDHWLGSNEGWLAFLVLIDQFPRNIYRGKPGSYELDPLALKRALEGMENQRDLELPLLARPYIYLPIMHAEDREMQRKSVALAEDLLRQASSKQRKFCEIYLESAVEHRDIVARFGRYPHRNEILGRESTPEEQAFLADSDFLKRV